MDRTQAAAATAESSPESDSDPAAAVFWPEWPVPLGPPGCRGAASVFRLPQPELAAPPDQLPALRAQNVCRPSFEEQTGGQNKHPATDATSGLFHTPQI